MRISLNDPLLFCPLCTRAKGFFRHEPGRDESMAVSKPVEGKRPRAQAHACKSVILWALHLIKLEPPLSLLPSGNVVNQVPLEVRRT
jgi:hypothetical protein